MFLAFLGNGTAPPEVTYNAASNDHMVAINAELGYELLEPLERSYELPVANA